MAEGVKKDLGERVSALEAIVERMCTNDLPHIYEALKDIRTDIKATQKFIVGEGILVFIAMVGLALKVFL